MSAAPIAAVLAVMAVGGVIAAYVYDTNRRGAVVLSNDLIDAVDQRIALQMGAYLQPAEQFLESARAIAGERGVFDGALAVEPFVLATIGKYAQLTGFSYGDPEGNFLYVTRNAQGGLDSKLIDRRAGGRKITWTRRNAEGAVLEIVDDPGDTFDVLTRSWYKGAVEEGRPFWTTPYLFFTVRRPGITYALPHYGANRRLVAVLGVDIELAALSTFLKSLEIGVHSKAMVVDAKGRVIAYPSDDWLARAKEGAALPQLDDLGDPMLTRIYNRLRVEGFSRKVLEVDGQRIIVSSGALRALTGRNWSVLIVARESDLLGFVQSSGWLALALSAVVLLLIVALATLMMWRSLGAERRDRAAHEREQALEACAQTLTELAAASHLMDRASTDGVREATERAAEICGGKRVGVWYLTAAGRTLVCEDNFDCPGQAHTAGAELHRDEFPALFGALEAMATIDAPHAARDSRTRELSAHYLQPLGIEGVQIIPIHSGDRLLGMLEVEDPVRGHSEAGMAEFCAALASLLALRYLPATTLPLRGQPEAQDPQRAVEQKVERALVERQASLEHRLLHYALSPADLAAGRIDRAAVAVIRLPDWMTIARRADGGQRARMDAVIDRIQGAVTKSPLAYAALLDDQVVLAAHSAGPSAAVEARIVAMVALELRDRLIELTSGWGEGSEFRVALDIGPVMASRFGNDNHCLWGGAIAVAKVLAHSGGRRAITVSETAYQILSDDFLFRQRGTYFLPETGTMRTFVLVGAPVTPRSLVLADGARQRRRRFGDLLAATGAAVLRRIEAVLVFAAFCTTAVTTALRRDSWRRPVRTVFMDTLHRVAVQSAPTTLGTGLLLGVVLVTQVVYWLETAGQTQLVGSIVVRLLVREIAPVVVGLIIFGRVGTDILITIGEARPAGWLRQLERQGIDPMALLVMPRMVAFSVGAFCMCTLLLVSTLIAGYLIASALGLVTVPIWRFGQNVLFAMDFDDFIIPPAKCMVIGMAIALVCSATALSRTTRTYELQRLVQRGFVRAALAILVVNGVFDLVA